MFQHPIVQNSCVGRPNCIILSFIHVATIVCVGMLSCIILYLGIHVSALTCMARLNIVVSFYLSASTCLPLPVWGGLITNTTNNTYGTYVNITCEDGKRFEMTNAEMWVIHCKADGRWDPGLSRCIGEFHVSLIVFFFNLISRLKSSLMD